MAFPYCRWEFLFLCLLPFGLLAQDPSDLQFDQLTDEDGLSNGFVTSIYQDEKGFIWLGTANGLNRYDGYQFKWWKPEENSPNSLSQANIWALHGTEDDIIWIGTRKGLNRFDPQTETFTHYFHDPNDDYSLNDDHILAISQDSAMNLWVGTRNGLCVFQKETHDFCRLIYYPQNSDDKNVRGIVHDEAEKTWFGIMDTLFCYDDDEGSLVHFPLPFSGESEDSSDNYVRVVFQDGNKGLWLSTENNGVHLFEKQYQQFVAHYANDSLNTNSLSHNRVNAFYQDDNAYLWMGSNGGGLNILGIDQQHFQHPKPDPLNDAYQNFDYVWQMKNDQSENIWLGTYYGGVKIILRHRKPFVNYVNIPGNHGNFGGTSIGSLNERRDGSIWVPIKQWGLAIFDPNEQSFSQFISEMGLPNSLQNASSILEEKNGDLWVTTSNNLLKMDGHTQQWEELNPSGMPSQNTLFYSQFIDSQGNHWIGAQGGLFEYDRASNTLISANLTTEKVNANHGSNTYITSICGSKNGDLWVGTLGGLNHRKIGTKQFTFFPFHKSILSVHQDQRGTIWLGTINGLAFFDDKKGKIEPHTNSKVFTERSINNILEDDHGRLWMGTSEGIVNFDPANSSYQIFNQKGSLAINQFLGPHLKSKDGDLYFVGSKGLLRFHPDSIRENPLIPPVVLTNFQLLNQDVPIRGSLADTLAYPSPLTKNIAYTDTLILEHWQNDFAFEFSALDFTDPLNNRYQFMLEGYEKSWVETEASRRFARYTDLGHGDYTFRVIGSNNDEKWNMEGASVFIRILPPWWQSWWAYILWIGLVLGTLLFIIRYEFHRRLANAEARRLLELDAVKTKLFTNITHEFRTPLTVILGMAELVKGRVKEDLRTHLSLIQRNGQQLLSLINQLLDLSKLESGSLKLEMIQGDMVQYLRYLTESFHSLATNKKIQLHFRSQLAELKMDFEPVRLQQVISNLLSNAIKFTPQGGEVSLFVNRNKNYLEIKVLDTGLGIPEEMLSKVFDRFFQIDDPATKQEVGTGIGLALAKELVHLMKGEIFVNSQAGAGTTFSIMLPITQAQQESALVLPTRTNLTVSPILSSSPTLHQDKTRQAPIVLLVEDNKDVIHYLISCLEANYRIELAFNGQEGIEKAIAITPDLIISDVMMPQKDGYELCQTLKSDLRTSHIPIILLTAKADMESKLAGLGKGADVYLAKPFNKKELETHMVNLLKVRENLRTHYLSNAVSTSAPNENGTFQLNLAQAMEHAFIQRVVALIKEDLSKQWEVNELAEALNISASQLHRKLKALLGMHTTEFIRYIRLSKASQLLHEKREMNISGIAYQVGFNSPSEFSRRFKELYQLSPRDWRSQQKT